MSTAAPELLETGSTFGAYKIEGLIGRGGMGVVYEATQLSLSRKVAVKVLSFTLADDSSFRERFRREQRVMAAFEHPNVCPIYEAGEVDGRLYLVMRLVRGPTLKDLIVAQELDPGRTAQIIAQTADALDTAHEAGLIHRDIKPQNVLIDERDHAYLADFGLAVTSSEIGITQTGQFVGTIDYVSPEQIRGEPATAMADVYALGCVLYEALTGEVPYPRDSDAAVLYAHLSDPPPVPSRQQPSLSPAFDAIVARALAKDPHARYPTAGSLADAVLAAAEGAPPPPVPASPAPELGIAAAVEAPAPRPRPHRCTSRGPATRRWNPVGPRCTPRRRRHPRPRRSPEPRRRRRRSPTSPRSRRAGRSRCGSASTSASATSTTRSPTTATASRCWGTRTWWGRSRSGSCTRSAARS